MNIIYDFFIIKIENQATSPTLYITHAVIVFTHNLRRVEAQTRSETAK